MKYLIKWNAGYGESTNVVDCETLEEAEEFAAHECRDEAEMNSTYEAEPLNEENAYDYGHEDELEEGKN